MADKEQGLLFEMDPWWKEHWREMPEFDQKDLAPRKQLTVNFASEDDVAAFAELVGQSVGMETRSIWYPEADIGHFVQKRFSAEAPEGFDPMASAAAPPVFSCPRCGLSYSVDTLEPFTCQEEADRCCA